MLSSHVKQSKPVEKIRKRKMKKKKRHKQAKGEERGLPKIGIPALLLPLRSADTAESLLQPLLLDFLSFATKIALMNTINF